MDAKRLAAVLMLAGAAGWLIQRYRQRMDFAGRSVLITGGSRGLGLELAKQLAQEGARLTLLARDPDELQRAQEKLRQLGAAHVLAIPCDIRDRQQVREAVRRTLERWGRIDVLINNAGVISFGPFEHMQTSDFENAMAVHFWGPLYLIQETLPAMKRQGGGRIVNIASIGGLVAMPHAIPYCASKFALVGLSRGVQAELARHGIRVTTVCPGLMRTGSHVNATFKGRHDREFAWFALANALPVMSISASRAARQIIRACRDGDGELVISTQARLLNLVESLLPGLTAGALQIVNRL
ncbi:MAG TPA: SDR family oxidoreductase, partial [Phycisphaeraceae bacterium]